MKAIRPPMSLDLNMAVRKSLDAKPLTAPPVKPAVLELGSAPVEEIKSSEPLKTPRVVHYTELRTPLENSALPPAPASPTPSVRPSPATSSGAAPAPQTSGREVREITLDAPTGTPFPPESKDKPAGSK